MKAKQISKYVVVVTIISYGMQFAMLRPGESWQVAAVLGTVCLLISLLLTALAWWITAS